MNDKGMKTKAKVTAAGLSIVALLSASVPVTALADSAAGPNTHPTAEATVGAKAPESEKSTTNKQAEHEQAPEKQADEKRTPEKQEDEKSTEEEGVTQEQVNAAKADYDKKKAEADTADEKLNKEKEITQQVKKKAETTVAAAKAQEMKAAQAKIEAEEAAELAPEKQAHAKKALAAAEKKETQAKNALDEFDRNPGKFPGVENLTTEQKTDLLEVILLEKINHYRESAGLPKNAYAGGMYHDAARAWSKHMSVDDAYVHNPSRPGSGGECIFLTENKGDVYAMAQRLFDGWRESPSHNDVFLWGFPTVHTMGIYFDDDYAWATYRNGAAGAWYEVTPQWLAPSKNQTGIDATTDSDYDPKNDPSDEPVDSGNRRLDVRYTPIRKKLKTVQPLDYKATPQEKAKLQAEYEAAKKEVEAARAKVAAAEKAVTETKAQLETKKAELAKAAQATQAAQKEQEKLVAAQEEKQAKAEKEFAVALESATQALRTYNDLLAQQAAQSKNNTAPLVAALEKATKTMESPAYLKWSLEGHKALADVVANGQKVLANPKATQDELDKATKELNTVLDKDWVVKPVTPQDPDKKPDTKPGEDTKKPDATSDKDKNPGAPEGNAERLPLQPYLVPASRIEVVRHHALPKTNDVAPIAATSAGFLGTLLTALGIKVNARRNK